MYLISNLKFQKAKFNPDEVHFDLTDLSLGRTEEELNEIIDTITKGGKWKVRYNEDNKHWYIDKIVKQSEKETPNIINNYKEGAKYKTRVLLKNQEGATINYVSNGDEDIDIIKQHVYNNILMVNMDKTVTEAVAFIIGRHTKNIKDDVTYKEGFFKMMGAKYRIDQYGIDYVNWVKLFRKLISIKSKDENAEEDLQHVNWDFAANTLAPIAAQHIINGDEITIDGVSLDIRGRCTAELQYMISLISNKCFRSVAKIKPYVVTQEAMWYAAYTIGRMIDKSCKASHEDTHGNVANKAFKEGMKWIASGNLPYDATEVFNQIMSKTTDSMAKVADYMEKWHVNRIISEFHKVFVTWNKVKKGEQINPEDLKATVTSEYDCTSSCMQIYSCVLGDIIAGQRTNVFGYNDVTQKLQLINDSWSNIYNGYSMEFNTYVVKSNWYKKAKGSYKLYTNEDGDFVSIPKYHYKGYFVDNIFFITEVIPFVKKTGLYNKKTGKNDYTGYVADYANRIVYKEPKAYELLRDEIKFTDTPQFYGSVRSSDRCKQLLTTKVEKWIKGDYKDKDYQNKLEFLAQLLYTANKTVPFLKRINSFIDDCVVYGKQIPTFMPKFGSECDEHYGNSVINRYVAKTTQETINATILNEFNEPEESSVIINEKLWTEEEYPLIRPMLDDMGRVIDGAFEIYYDTVQVGEATRNIGTFAPTGLIHHCDSLVCNHTVGWIRDHQIGFKYNKDGSIMFNANGSPVTELRGVNNSDGEFVLSIHDAFITGFHMISYIRKIYANEYLWIYLNGGSLLRNYMKSIIDESIAILGEDSDIQAVDIDKLYPDTIESRLQALIDAGYILKWDDNAFKHNGIKVEVNGTFYEFFAGAILKN